ncbi:MAG: DUF3394 domain-containing protein, partial [Acidobacteriota bacterium]
RIGAASFIVPFMFIFEPSLLMIGDWWTILLSATSATIGVICIAGGLHGYFWREARIWERLVLIGAAFMLIKPGLVTDAIGLALLGVVLLNQIVLSPATAVMAKPPAK